MIRAVILDIEGTTSSLHYVRNVLVPYSRSRLATWINRPTPEVEEVIRQVRTTMGRPQANVTDVVERLQGWIDLDIKAAPLKTLQGYIWASGYATGELAGHVYDDVPHALRTWKAQGLRIAIYSSGSVLAQREWFRTTQYGDLLPLLAGHFDIMSAGPKHDAASYRAIAAVLGLPERQIAFLSDARAELDAAQEAGMWSVGVIRSAPAPDHGDHLSVGGFGDLDLTGERPRLRAEARDA